MKRIMLTIILSLTAVAAANAQYFDLSLNKGRYEVGINLSQVATNTQYSRLTLGGSLMAWGVYMGITTALPQHRYDNTVSDTKWNDDKVFLIHAGYQLPVLKWLRIMPLVGYMQTNEGITDASKLNAEADDDTTVTLYHPYKVTPGSRIHYLDFGGGISVQPLKWFSINLIYTRYSIQGGIGISIQSFAHE